MSLTSTDFQKYESHVDSIALTTTNGIKNNDTTCSAIDCISRPISRCTICSEYFCYLHGHKHIHSLDNFEILR